MDWLRMNRVIRISSLLEIRKFKYFLEKLSKFQWNWNKFEYKLVNRCFFLFPQHFSTSFRGYSFFSFLAQFQSIFNVFFVLHVKTPCPIRTHRLQKKKNILHTLDRMFWNGTLFNLHYFSEQRLHVTSFKMKCLNLIYQHWHQICKTFFGLTKYLFGLENNWMCTFLLTHFNTWKTHQSHFSSTVMV